MDNRCIFCGEVLGTLQRKKLPCGNVPQILCRDCYPKYEGLSSVERAEAALKTGRADRAAELREYLEGIYAARQKKEDLRKAGEAKRATDMQCLRCSGRMLDFGPITFKLGEETYFFSDFNRFISGSLTMKVMKCETCGKLEFFATEDTVLAEDDEED